MKTDPYRVMVVDDSAIIRGLISKWLDAEPDISVVSTAADGEAAVRMVAKSEAEMVLLDIEMPRMDGLTALPKLIQEVPGLRVIMASTLTHRNADITLRALSNGAVDYVPKPESTRHKGAAAEFRRELLEKVKSHGAALRRAGPRPARRLKKTDAEEKGKTSGKGVKTSLYSNKSITLRRPSMVQPRILAVGSSTGGPQALLQVFGHLKESLLVPAVITQHMPATFTAILAEHIAQSSGLVCREAEDGESLENGRIYLAPGDYHMVLERTSSGPVLRLNQDPPVNFCRPSVDPLFKSIAEVYGPAVLSVILTGMGQDGLAGSRALVEAGGTVVAQDEATSVVWGMPGAVATEGLCSQVRPLSEIGPMLARYVSGGRA